MIAHTTSIYKGSDSLECHLDPELAIPHKRPDIAVHGLYELLYDRQADTARTGMSGGISLVIPVKYLVRIRMLTLFEKILERDPHSLAFFGLYRQLDLSVTLNKAVTDKILHNPLQRLLISEDPDAFFNIDIDFIPFFLEIIIIFEQSLQNDLRALDRINTYLQVNVLDLGIKEHCLENL